MMNDTTNNERRRPPYGVNFAAGLLMLVGWGGLYFLVQNVRPTAGPRWYFFILMYIAVVGTSLPIVRFVNVRFRQQGNNISDAVILRQSLWIGLYVTIAAWLQILRVLGVVLAVLLALAFVAIEAFLGVRENLQTYEE